MTLASFARRDRDSRDAEHRDGSTTEVLAHRDLEKPAEDFVVTSDERANVLLTGAVEPSRDVVGGQTERVCDDVVEARSMCFTRIFEGKHAPAYHLRAIAQRWNPSLMDRRSTPSA
jgi:hypothetical protein